MTSRIDVHHHWVPDVYASALREGGGDPSGWIIPDWSIEKDKIFCDKEAISFSILSITAPGAAIVPKKEQVKFCRQMNELAAKICSDNARRYGFFATVPDLVDFHDEALVEIRYALRELGAQGVTLFTRYGDANFYLGHSKFEAVFDLLNALEAVVFVHPTHPVDTKLVNGQLPQPMLDYPHETTRTAADMILAGTMQRCTKCKVILSHAGGTLPYLAYRPALMLPHMPDAKIKSADEFVRDAKRFYFDTALSTPSTTLGLLKSFAAPGHVLFGSDYPYAPEAAIHDMNKLLDDYAAQEDQVFVDSLSLDNGLALFPNLRSVLAKT